MTGCILPWNSQQQHTDSINLILNGQPLQDLHQTLTQVLLLTLPTNLQPNQGPHQTLQEVTRPYQDLHLIPPEWCLPDC